MIPVEPDKVIMRYIDLEKLNDMMETSSLFFCRADKFPDHFEGSLPQKEYESRIRRGFVSGFERLHLNMKKFTLINCWHINENESDAMWRLYLKSNEGVAVQTTIEKICSVLKNSHSTFRVSKVRYIDYEKDIWYDDEEYPVKSYNAIIPLVHKRNEYKHENEFRILFDIDHAYQSPDYWANAESSIGKKIEIRDIARIIDRLILPPSADEIVRDKVEKIMDKFNCNIEICKSKLMNKPFY
ncbi:MAG: DUF2971 domain-containing protein [Bacteroidota bacterium]|nr:DUF2971 domain-containing protein [Bacteroidota bacterium]